MFVILRPEASQNQTVRSFYSTEHSGPEYSILNVVHKHILVSQRCNFIVSCVRTERDENNQLKFKTFLALVTF